MNSNKSNRYNKDTVSVSMNVFLPRLLFNNIFLHLILTRELVKDFTLPDPFLKFFADHQMAVFKGIEKLHSLFLPFDSDLGSIDLKEGLLKPEYRQDV